MKPYYQDNYVTIYHGDCREILPQLPSKSVDLVLTDPPFPDQHPEYGDCNITFLDEFNCRQLIFWSAKVDFPLSYTAIHIWDKRAGGLGSFYERIFERNGQRVYRVFGFSSPSNKVRADYTQDKVYGHPSQKPYKLIDQLILMCNSANLILDPFLGSGTTCYCAKKLNRKCIGIEIEEKYCEIAANRCRQMVFDLVV